MHKRVFTTALTILLAAFMLAGCGSKTPAPGGGGQSTPGGSPSEGGGTSSGGETETVTSDYLSHGAGKDFAAGGHVWGEDNKCTVCNYALPVTEGLVYTDVEGGLKVGYDWENASLLEETEIVIPAYHDGKKVVEVCGAETETGEEEPDTFAAADIETVAVPNTVEKVDAYAFCQCAALEEAYIGGGTLGKGVFQECEALEKVTLPEGLPSIPASTFWYCTHLRECDIPETVTEIGDNAFNECRHLIRITLPAGLQTVGAKAFKLCGRLAEICNLSEVEFEPHAEDVNNEVSYLGVYTEVIVTEKAQMGTFTEKDDFLFYKSAAGKNYLVSYDGSTADLTLPATAPDGSKYVVHGYAFDTLDFDLTSVTLGDGVTALGYSAFGNCRKLTSCTFGNCLESIGDYCFNATYLLAEVTLPASLNYIGHAAFWTSRSTYGLQRATFAEPTGWTWKGDAKEPLDLSDPAQNAQYLAHTSNRAPNLYWQRTAD